MSCRQLDRYILALIGSFQTVTYDRSSVALRVYKLIKYSVKSDARIDL